MSKKKKDYEDESEENELTEDEMKEQETVNNIFSDIEGLSENDEIIYSIYRKNTSTGTSDYIDKVIPPFGVDNIKTMYGGGRYTIYAKITGKKGIVGKRVVCVAGSPKELEKNNLIINENNNKTDMMGIIELMKAVKSLDNDRPAESQSMKMMNEALMTLQAGMVSMMGSQLEMSKKTMEMMREMGEGKNGTGVNDLIKDGLGMLKELGTNFMIMKNKNVARAYSGNEEDEIKKIENETDEKVMIMQKYQVLMEYMTGYQENLINIEFVENKIRNNFKELVNACKMAEFEQIKDVLIQNGLIITDEKKIEELYIKLR